MKKISGKYIIYGRKKGRKRIYSTDKDFFANYKINLEKDKSWVKPLALQKYIDEETPGMVAEIKNLIDNGDRDPLI